MAVGGVRPPGIVASSAPSDLIVPHRPRCHHVRDLLQPVSTHEVHFEPQPSWIRKAKYSKAAEPSLQRRGETHQAVLKGIWGPVLSGELEPAAL